MRFRATIDNVPTFLRIAQTVEKLQKKYIITLTPTQMKIICNNDNNDGGVQVWSVIKISSIFSSYRIVSNSSNEITMQLDAEALTNVLRSSLASSLSSSLLSSDPHSTNQPNPNASSTHPNGIANANSNPNGEDQVTIRLAKKNDQAILAFEIHGTTRLGREVVVTHDVRVELFKRADVERLREPLCPEPDVHVLLPPLPKLRTIVDRLKPLSSTLSIRASDGSVTSSHSASSHPAKGFTPSRGIGGDGGREDRKNGKNGSGNGGGGGGGGGVLKLGIRTDSVCVETTWRGVVNPDMRGGGGGGGGGQDPTPGLAPGPAPAPAPRRSTRNRRRTTRRDSRTQSDGDDRPESESEDDDEYDGGRGDEDAEGDDGDGDADRAAEGEGEGEEKMYQVVVPIKGFLKFLNSHIVSTNTIACICHAHCLILYVYIGALADAGGVLTYYIPTILDE